jgi:hypothetical protein
MPAGGVPPASVPAIEPMVPPAPDAAVEDAAPPPPPDSRPADQAIVADAAPPAPAFTVTGVATWRGGAEGVYSIIQDGVCDSDGAFAHADPELTRRNLHGGFGVIVGSCGASPGGKWPQIKGLLAHGHDVFNHSWSHSCLAAARDCVGNGAPTIDFGLEIDRSTQVLEDALGVPVQYFVFPFDACGADAIGRLKQRGYLGARCGARGISQAAFPDGFATRFDSWGPSFSVYGNAGPCKGLTVRDSNMPPEMLPPACRSYVLDQYVDDAIAAKGWAIRALTGFSDEKGAFQPIALGDYTAHLDHVRRQVDAGLLWVEGPTVVIRYRWAREKCSPATVVGNVLRFPQPSADCRKFATTLSYLVATADMSDPPSVKVTQGSATVTAKKTAPGRFVVNADPTGGDVIVGQ